MNRTISKNTVVYVVVILFASVSLMGILFHEIWMDEAHHWLLSRDSSNLNDLWENSRYEGHPILWNILLFVMTRFTTNPPWMQLLHWLISGPPGHSPLTLVTYDSISIELPGIVFIKEFTHAMIKVENYYIYEISASGND